MKFYLRRVQLIKYHWKFVQGSLYSILAISFIINVIPALQHHYSDYLLNSLEGPIKYDDPELIQYIRAKLLEPPSKEAYNIYYHAMYSKHRSEKFYDHFTKLLFENERDGFFIEAGALDGQSMSNTLNLEMKQGWTGLLIEPDPANYIALMKKNRKAWTAKACLSMYKYPKKERLSSFDIITNTQEYKDLKRRSMGSIIQKDKKGLTSDETSNTYYESQCLPLGSFLLALNVSRVDLFSLDVEFIEEQVIRNFDFKRFDVQVLFMEWWDHDKLLWLKEFMTKKDYMFAANDLGDIIFVKNNTKYSRRILEKHPNRTFVVFKNVVSSNERGSHI